jgi:hypothetical protein
MTISKKTLSPCLSRKLLFCRGFPTLKLKDSTPPSILSTPPTVHQQPLGEEETIAGMLNAPDGPFTGEVLSTMIFYNNCYYRDRKSDKAKYLRDSPGAYLGQRISDNYALIPLNLPGSPFSEAVYFIYNSDKLDGVTTDYFQAALLIQNAPAAATYSGN